MSCNRDNLCMRVLISCNCTNKLHAPGGADACWQCLLESSDCDQDLLLVQADPEQSPHKAHLLNALGACGMDPESLHTKMT